MPTEPRKVEFHTYRQPSLAGACLNPAQALTATPTEVIAMILQALEPLPPRLEVIQATNSSIHIFDPDTRVTNLSHNDRAVGAFIKYGIRMAEAVEAVCEIFRNDASNEPDRQKDGGGDEGDVQVEMTA